MKHYKISYIFYNKYMSDKCKDGYTIIESSGLYNGLYLAVKAFQDTHDDTKGWYEITKVELVEVEE